MHAMENTLAIYNDQQKFTAYIVDSRNVGHLRYLHGVDFGQGGF